jgi:hypothetical protein
LQGQGRCPAAVAVVEDDGQDRRQLAIRRQAFLGDEVLPEQAGVDQHAKRHPLVGGGLELEQQDQVGVAAVAAWVDVAAVAAWNGVAAAAAGDAPDHVAFAPIACVGVELRVQALHGGEIEFIEPGAGDELAQGLGDHVGWLNRRW